MNFKSTWMFSVIQHSQYSHITEILTACGDSGARYNNVPYFVVRIGNGVVTMVTVIRKKVRPLFPPAAAIDSSQIKSHQLPVRLFSFFDFITHDFSTAFRKEKQWSEKLLKYRHQACLWAADETECLS